MRRRLFDMLLKLLKTQWENKEKMIQHIVIVISLDNSHEKNLEKGKLH
jgi:hypothetical protein